MIFTSPIKSFIISFTIILSVVLVPHPAKALRTAIIYGLGFKLDKSFNESAFHGVIKLRETKKDILEYSPRSEHERQLIIEEAARNSEHVITVGSPQAEAVAAVAPKFPNTKFTAIGADVHGQNIQPVNFREQEGAFLAGIAAAMASNNQSIGFVGGMYLPVIKRFLAGYEQGARYVSPNIRILSGYIGTTTYAFNNPMGGYLIARQQIRDGADVIFAAAGSSGLGAYQAADESIAYAIGVDSNQNHLFPTTMLTSLVKEVGRTLIHVVQTADAGQWSNTPKSFGLKEGAFSMAVDHYNTAHYSENIRDAVHNARVKIITGEITVSSDPTGKSQVGVVSP